MERMGLAVWSVGAHARRNLLPAIAQTQHWRFAGCNTRNREVGIAEAAAHDGRWFETPQAMLADASVDAVLLAGPNGTHFAHAKATLEAGKAALVEKTLCPEHAQTQELVALASAKALLLAECFMYKHHPQFSALRTLVATVESHGRVHSISARFGFPHLQTSDIRYSSVLAGGALLDAGAYCLSSLAALADGARLRWAQLEQPTGYEVDIAGAVGFDLGDGAAFGDWGFGRAYRNEIEIWCERAIIRAPRAFSKPADLATTITVTDVDDRVTEYRIPPANHFVAMLDAMGSAMTDAASRCAFADAAERQSALLHAVRAQGTP